MDLDNAQPVILGSSSGLHTTRHAGTLLPTPGRPTWRTPAPTAPARGCLSNPRQFGLPSACEALAGRLELAAIVDVDREVRDALATLAEWMRTGDYGTVEIARWLGSVHRDVAP
jgi:hypothetical protein